MNIIGGEVVQSTPVCVIMRPRNIQATILGRRPLSPLALPFMLTFENNDLNLGETLLLQKEVNPIKKKLQFKKCWGKTVVHSLNIFLTNF